MTRSRIPASHRSCVRELLTCAGHSYYITRFADYVIHDSDDTKLIPRLLETGKQVKRQDLVTGQNGSVRLQETVSPTGISELASQFMRLLGDLKAKRTSGDKVCNIHTDILFCLY